VTSAADRVAGSLLGLALGDALGFMVEARPPEEAAAFVRDRLGEGDAAEPCLPDAFGQYSDDTQLARELLASVVDAGGWRPEVFAQRIGVLFQSALDIGAGPGTRSAALRIAAGARWDEAACPAPYAGNGSAMRVGPLGALLARQHHGLRRAAAEQSRVTHQDPRCAAGAVAVAGAAALAAAPGPLDRRRFLDALTAWVRPEEPSVAEALTTLNQWGHLEPVAAARRLHALGLDPAFDGRWQGISTFVVPSVVWSLYAFLRSPDDYLETVRTAIAVGGDTDTMAAMAGAIAGARLGPAALPAALVDRLHDRGRWRAPELTALAVQAASAAAG
jgi:ADP-ribosylglycohydrolase